MRYKNKAIYSEAQHKIKLIYIIFLYI